MGRLYTAIPLLSFEIECNDRWIEGDCSDLPNGYQVSREQLKNLEIFNKEGFKREFGEAVFIKTLPARFCLSVSKENVNAQELSTAIANSNEKIDRFLLALNINERLCKFDSDVRFSWFQDGTLGHVTKRQVWPRSTIESNPQSEDFVEAARLTEVIDMVYPENDNDQSHHYPSVRTAFDALRLGSGAYNVSMHFLLEAIALEALCSDSASELTHRIATTCAILMEAGLEERKALYKKVKNLYGIRSRIAHGTGQWAKTDQLKEMEHITRGLLRRILAADVLPNFETAGSRKEFLLHLGLERDSRSGSPV